MQRKFKHSDLKDLGPCPEAWKWARTQKSAKSAWNNCQRSDWLVWLLEHIQPLTKPQAVAILVEVAKDCLAQFEKRYPCDERPRRTIEAAENWLKDPTQANVSAADAPAWSAAEAAVNDCAWSAADAATAAASAAWSAAADARSAASAAADVTWYAPSVAKKRQAEIIRKVVPCPFE